MNDCYCDYDPPEFYHSQMQKARKEHKCSECRKAIRVGETYEHVFGKWAGNVDYFDTCPRCLALREYVRVHVPCFCWAHGRIREDAMDVVREYSREAPGLLFGAWRREVAIMRQERIAK